jgi:hypothetical protein
MGVIRVPQATLADLRDRLKRTRWIAGTTHADWDRGTNAGYLKELHAYWQEQFDWRAPESLINRFAH